MTMQGNKQASLCIYMARQTSWMDYMIEKTPYTKENKGHHKIEKQAINWNNHNNIASIRVTIIQNFRRLIRKGVFENMVKRKSQQLSAEEMLLGSRVWEDTQLHSQRSEVKCQLLQGLNDPQYLGMRQREECELLDLFCRII